MPGFHIIGVSAALVSAASWAVGAIMMKKVGRDVSASGMNLVKASISLALLGVAWLFIGIEHMEPGTFLLLGVSGLLGISLGDTFFFKSLQKLSPLLLVLLTMSGQVLTVLLATIFLGDLLTAKMWIGVLMAVCGVSVVLYFKISKENRKSSISGVIYGLLFVMCMAISTIIAKKGLAYVSALQATFIRMLWGMAGLFIWGAASGQLRKWISPFREASLIKNMTLAVCVVTFGGFWLSHVSLKYIEVSVANTLNSTEPLFLIPLGAIFLKERITLSAILGTIVSVSGVTLLLVR